MHRYLAVAGMGAIVFFALLFSDGRPPAGAEGMAASDELLQKLDEIAAGQKTILGKLEEMRNELAIIKIRITQNQ